ncbi:MAG: LysM peptidoglycan-binding domain-containing protein [Caldilineaceae bacterium]
MSRRNAGAPPARSIVAAAMPNGGQESFVRRVILCFMVFSVLSIFSPFYTTAEAAPSEIAAAAMTQAAGTTAMEATQSPIAAWSCRGVYHVVGRGETIYSIARRYGTTAYRIAVCNGLASYTVYVGQALLVPTARS